MPEVKSPTYAEGMTSAASGADASFLFADPDEGRPSAASFRYSVDGGQAMSIPADNAAPSVAASVSGAAGSHTLTVTAVDSYGVASLPSSYSWTIGDPGYDSTGSGCHAGE